MKLRVLLTLAAVFVVGFIFYLAFDGMSKVGINQGYEPDQPIHFSHKIHVGENEIQCMYCHSGAEKSRHAGIPSASTCLNCHTIIKKDSPEIQKIVQAIKDKKPIKWNKVHRMADFAYFSHEQHVGSGKISCQKCHGPVQTMTRMRQEKDLTMGWCIDCHRESDVVVHGKTDEKLIKKVSDVGGMDCAKCHY